MVTVDNIRKGSIIVDSSGRHIITIADVNKEKRRVFYRFPHEDQNSESYELSVEKNGCISYDWVVKNPLIPIKVRIGDLV